ncbi:hypothetical protein KRR40_20050 [Niabella defluvii]|nr:hypothetical protein KRR40_20050 [Niabella sp. I65]
MAIQHNNYTVRREIKSSFGNSFEKTSVLHKSNIHRFLFIFLAMAVVFVSCTQNNVKEDDAPGSILMRINLTAVLPYTITEQACLPFTT